MTRRRSRAPVPRARSPEAAATTAFYHIGDDMPQLFDLATADHEFFPVFVPATDSAPTAVVTDFDPAALCVIDTFLPALVPCAAAGPPALPHDPDGYETFSSLQFVLDPPPLLEVTAVGLELADNLARFFDEHLDALTNPPDLDFDFDQLSDLAVDIIIGQCEPAHLSLATFATLLIPCLPAGYEVVDMPGLAADFMEVLVVNGFDVAAGLLAESQALRAGASGQPALAPVPGPALLAPGVWKNDSDSVDTATDASAHHTAAAPDPGLVCPPPGARAYNVGTDTTIDGRYSPADMPPD